MDLTVSAIPGAYAITRLNPDSAIPSWASSSGAFFSITRTTDELSLVTPQESVPPDALHSERGWRMLGVLGPLDFALKGILTYLITPLADAGISVFAISTYDTDYILIKEEYFSTTMEILASICTIQT